MISFSQKKVDSSSFSSNSKTEQIQISVSDSTISHLLQPFSQKKELRLEKNGPWLAALFIGILTVLANILTSYYMRRISRDTVKAQIESSERTAGLNIENSQTLSLTQFKATLKTKNRQDWINDVRESITEFTTQCKMLNIEFQSTTPDPEKVKPLLEKVTLYRNKLLLLLNPAKETHKPLLNAIDSLMTVLEHHFFYCSGKIQAFNNEDFLDKTAIVIKCGRDLSYDEWQKIQEMLK